jgi:hypothetical protein
MAGAIETEPVAAAAVTRKSRARLTHEEEKARSRLLVEGRYRIRAIGGRWDLMLVLPITRKNGRGCTEPRLKKLQSFDTFMDAYHKAVELGEPYATKMVAATLQRLAYRLADAAAFATWREAQAATAAPPPQAPVVVQFTSEQVAAATAAANALAG